MARAPARTFLSSIASLAVAICVSASCGSTEPSEPEEPESFGFIRVQLDGRAHSVAELKTATFRLEDELSHSGIESSASTLVALTASNELGDCVTEVDLRSARRFGPAGSSGWLNSYPADLEKSESIVVAAGVTEPTEASETTQIVLGTDELELQVVHKDLENDGGPVSQVCPLMVGTGTLQNLSEASGVFGEVWVAPADAKPTTLKKLEESLQEKLIDRDTSGDLTLIATEP